MFKEISWDCWTSCISGQSKIQIAQVGRETLPLYKSNTQPSLHHKHCICDLIDPDFKKRGFEDSRVGLIEVTNASLVQLTKMCNFLNIVAVPSQPI